jgi:hypothetical protein
MFEEMADTYLKTEPMLARNKQVSEMEVRFQGKNGKPLTKMEYDRVVQHLRSSGFECVVSRPNGYESGVSNTNGTHYLRINSEYVAKDGRTMMSNIRAEITGIDLIQEYVRTNSIQKIIDLPSTLSFSSDKLKFTQKIPSKNADGTVIRPVDFADLNIRVAYQMEKDYHVHSMAAKEIIERWQDNKKTFRHMNRVRFQHPVFPVFADLSIVRNSKKTKRGDRGGGIMVPQFTIQESGVLDDTPHYEIELEIDNLRVGTNTRYNTKEKLVEAIQKVIRIVLGAIQDTNYPIGNEEHDQMLQAYMTLVNGPTYQPRRVFPKDFTGPNSFPLQMENIVVTTETSNVPNIRNRYTVTDKADGERKMLYVNENGRMYLIDTNMRVSFTGATTSEKHLRETLIDGEHIKYNKRGEYINLYAAFDIYYIYRKSVREFAFMKTDDTIVDSKYRLLLLRNVIHTLLNPVSVVTKESTNAPGNNPCHFRVKCKEFEVASEDKSIFDCCAKVLQREKDGLFEYNTDGLIFTPIDFGVGANESGKAGPIYKVTWEHSFKWKPPQYNTVDFLVTVQKDKQTGRDAIHTRFVEGIHLGASQNIVQYKTLILNCGYDESKHGFLNPFQDMLDGRYANPDEMDNEDTYRPRPFIPTNPYDKTACLCNIDLHKDGNNHLFMKTHEGEYFEEDTIVEFSYDREKMSWVPLRVRYDKTAELLAGLPNFGNAYHVANSNWRSIHYPITESMIMSGLDIPEELASDTSEVYYNRQTKDTVTRALRDFHNLYVKRALITGVCKRKDTLIDFAVGKAGDLSKWVAAKLRFVMGVDLFESNIMDHTDGACARYLNMRKKYPSMPAAIFLQGNSANHIRGGHAFTSDKHKLISRALFGEGAKDRRLLGNEVFEHYGVGSEGFTVSSCQFAMHYFFENPTTFHGFLRNVAECTRLGGYFIGTCYDGKRVFDLLAKKNAGESVTIMKSGHKIFEITKRYDETGFPDDEMSIGYPIDVYQESINNVFREYLVNFDYLRRVMEDYGFVLVAKEEARQQFHLPNGMGSFEDLFRAMETDTQRNSRAKDNYGESKYLSKEEKQISFLNNYFVFKKMRTVNTAKIASLLTIPSAEMDAEDDDEAYEGIDRITRLTKKIHRQLEAEKQDVIDSSNPYIQKLDHPKMIIGAYRPVADTPITEIELVGLPAPTAQLQEIPIEMLVQNEISRTVQEAVEMATAVDDILNGPPPTVVVIPPEVAAIPPKRKYTRKPKLNVVMPKAT